MKMMVGFLLFDILINKEGGVSADTGWFEISSGSQDRVGFLHSPQEYNMVIVDKW